RRTGLAETQQQPALLGGGRGDPGTDGVGRVQPRGRASGLVRNMRGDKGAKFLKGRHSAPTSAAQNATRVFGCKAASFRQTESAAGPYRLSRSRSMLGVDSARLRRVVVS